MGRSFFRIPCLPHGDGFNLIIQRMSGNDGSGTKFFGNLAQQSITAQSGRQRLFPKRAFPRSSPNSMFDGKLFAQKIDRECFISRTAAQ